MEELLNEKFPPKPTKPLESECCGTGCTPCVFDIYEKQLKRWEEECNRIRSNLTADLKEDNEDINNSLTPEKYLQFKILSITPDAPSTNIYRFSSVPVTEDSKSVSKSIFYKDVVQIGQHVVIKIGDEAKQYTVLRAGSEDGEPYFDIIIKIYPKGRLTPLIGKLVVGEQVLMRGPFGKVFELKPNEFKFVIMLAAGTGIAPMYRIIEKILNNEEDYTKIKLIFSNRSVQSILLKSKLKEWSSFWNFQAIHFLTRNGNMEIPYGMDVRLKKFTYLDFSEICSKDIDSSYFLVCGTKSFEKDIVNYLRRANVDPERQFIF